MNKKIETLTIEGIEYVPKESITKMSNDVDGLKLCIIRTYSAGLWYGYVDYEAENTYSSVIIKNARRIWKWEGAFTASEISLHGMSNNSMIAETLLEVKLNRVIELIPVSQKAKQIIDNIDKYEV